jgi:hypothetical protein
MSDRPHVLEAAKKLNMIAEMIVREGLSCHEMPVAEFLEGEGNLVARSLESGAEASSRVREVVPTPTVETRDLQESAEAACNPPSLETSRPQSNGRPEVAGHGTNGSAADDSANAATQSSAMTALAKQNAASGWIAQRSGVELPMVPTPCTHRTPTRPNTMPSFPSCNMHGEAELNPGPNTDSTWLATELETLPTFNIGDWDTLCGEVELSAMPDVDHLWPFEGRRAVSMSNDDWSTLCGEVEISTMQNEPVAWPGSLGVEGFAALTSDGNQPDGGEVTSGRFIS